MIKHDCPHCKGGGKYTSKEAGGMSCEVCKGTGKLTVKEIREYDARVHLEMTAYQRRHF